MEDASAGDDRMHIARAHTFVPAHDSVWRLLLIACVVALAPVRKRAKRMRANNLS